MIDSIIFLEKITIEPPYRKILQRLGFKNNSTVLTHGQQDEYNSSIVAAQSFINLQGAIRREIITANDGRHIVLSGGFSFFSSQLAHYLRDCGEAVLMGATAGNTIMEAIKEKTDQGDLTAAVVYDATASEMVDAAMDWLMDYLNSQLRRERKMLLTNRFSAGYGDFLLANQKIMHEKLDLTKIGVAINADFILLPEKSVTAIAGIRS